MAQDKLISTLEEIQKKILLANTSEWGSIVENYSANEEIAENFFEKLKREVAESDLNDVFLRELLQASDGHCIKSFMESENRIKNSLQVSKHQQSSHVFLEWTLDLEHLLLQATKNALTSFVPPTVENIPIEEKQLTSVENTEKAETRVKCTEMRVTCQADTNNLLWKYTDEIFEWEVGENDWACSILIIKKQVPSIKRVILLECLAEKFLFKLGFLAICKQNDSVVVYDLEKNAFVYEFNLEQNSVPLALCPWTNNTFSCLVWNSETHDVTSSNLSGCLPLSEEPKLVEQNVNVYSFVHPDNTVTIWNPSQKVVLHISKLQHGLMSVDNVTIHDEKTLYLFDYKLHLAVKFQIDASSEEEQKCYLEKVLRVSTSLEGPIIYMGINGDSLIASHSSSEIYSSTIKDVFAPNQATK